MLPQSTIQRIADEAIETRKKYVKEEVDYGTRASAVSYMGIGFKEGYIAGAEKEAERAQGLVEALEKAKNMVRDLLNPNHTSPEVADKIVDIEIFLTGTLTKYNQPK